MTEENQPQAEEAQVEAQAGDTQLEVSPEQQELGAEEKPQAETKPEPKPERTYTQAQWSQRESEKDKEIAQYREHVAQLYMHAELAKAEQAEIAAKAQDQMDVEDGVITQTEAAQRQQARDKQKQIQQETAKQEGVLRQMHQQTEQFGKFLVAQDFGKQYKLTPEEIIELLSDKDITGPGDMKAKAADLAYERAQGELKKAKATPQVFDQGVSGTQGVDLSGKSPMELAQVAYSPEETKRRQRKK